MGSNIGKAIAGLSLREVRTHFDLSGDKRPDVPILRGGPVEPQRGFVLQTLDWGGQDILHVGNQWGLSGSLDVLRAISEGGGPSRYVIALGYAGWGQGQLEEEMTRHGWFGAPVSDQLLFGTSAQDRWSAARSANGKDGRAAWRERGGAKGSK